MVDVLSDCDSNTVHLDTAETYVYTEQFRTYKMGGDWVHITTGDGCF